MTTKLFLIILFTISCSQFVKKIDGDLFINESIPYKEDNRTMSCEKNNSIQLISRNKSGAKTFLQFVSEADYSYTEKVVFWTFVQMNLNPHLSSPSSNAQFLLNDDTYFEIKGSKSDKTPIFMGLQKLLRKSKSKKSLVELAKIFDRTYPNSFYVSQSFALFLSKNKEKVLMNKVLTRNFVRAEDTLRENERIPKQNFSLLLKRTNENDYKIKNFSNLTSFQNYHCNFDIKNYLAGSFTPNKETFKANTFGIKEGSNSILISLSSNTDVIENYERSIFIRGKASNQKSYVCIVKEKDKRIWVVGSDSRDPGQQVSQFLALTTGKDKKKIINAFKSPRYLSLEDPKRLIFESEKATKEEIENLQGLNIPLYSTSQIGHLAAYLSHAQTNTFFLDLRSPGELICTD